MKASHRCDAERFIPRPAGKQTALAAWNKNIVKLSHRMPNRFLRSAVWASSFSSAFASLPLVTAAVR